MDIAPTYPIYNQGCNPLTIRGMSHQVQLTNETKTYETEQTHA